MRAHLVQLDIRWENPAENYARVESLLRETALEPHDLVVLPEMFDSGFSLNVDVTADESGETRRFLADCAQAHNVYVYGGFTMRAPDGIGLNRAHLYGPDGACVCEYDKLHPFSYGRESERFVGGDNIVVCEWIDGEQALTVCPAICYDLRFPELFRHGLAQGAEVFVIGANWPADRARHWRSLLTARAIENQAYVIGVNRAGADPHLRYAGGSLIVDPTGEIVVDAGADECVVSGVIDTALLRAWRETFPAWRDWRRSLLGLDSSECSDDE